jgi:hypothetical protein
LRINNNESEGGSIAIQLGPKQLVPREELLVSRVVQKEKVMFNPVNRIQKMGKKD